MSPQQLQQQQSMQGQMMMQQTQPQQVQGMVVSQVQMTTDKTAIHNSPQGAPQQQHVQVQASGQTIIKQHQITMQAVQGKPLIGKYNVY